MTLLEDVVSHSWYDYHVDPKGNDVTNKVVPGNMLGAVYLGTSDSSNATQKELEAMLAEIEEEA